MQNRHVLSFFLTNRTGEEKELELGWIIPAYINSLACSSISSSRAGAYLYGIDTIGVDHGSNGIL
jgi:hypothetical protein